MGRLLDELREEATAKGIRKELLPGLGQTKEELEEDRRKVQELFTPEYLAQYDEPKKLLQSPDFLDKIQLELDKKIEGEQVAREVIFLVMNMRNVKNLSKASDNLMVNDDAGTGKDHIVSAIFELIPDNEKVKRERISPKVLAYLNDVKSNPEGWAKKLLYLEDVPNMVLNDDAFKVMSSANPNGVTQTSIVANNVLKNIDIRGKPTIVLTIAMASPKAELLRRYPICNLTSTINQTKAVLRKQAAFAKTGISQEYNPAIKKALTMLGRIPVKIPFADKINEQFPTENVIVRTHFPRFLDYIKSSCSLHQYQRKIDAEGYYLAEEQDYEIARRILAATTSNQLMIPQTRIEKQVLEVMAGLERKPWTIEELSEFMQGLGGESYIRKTLERLSKPGFVKKTHGLQEGKGRPPVLYSYNDMVKLDLPNFKDLDINPSRESNPNSETNPISPTNDLLDKMDYLDIIFTEQKIPKALEAALTRHKQGLELGSFYATIKAAGLPVSQAEDLIKAGLEQGLYFEPRPGVLRRLE